MPARFTAFLLVIVALLSGVSALAQQSAWPQGSGGTFALIQPEHGVIQGDTMSLAVQPLAAETPILLEAVRTVPAGTPPNEFVPVFKASKPNGASALEWECADVGLVNDRDSVLALPRSIAPFMALSLQPGVVSHCFTLEADVGASGGPLVTATSIVEEMEPPIQSLIVPLPAASADEGAE